MADQIADAIAQMAEEEDSRQNREMAQRIFTALNITYPGHNWEVYCDIKAGHFHFKNLRLSTKHGVILHPKHLDDVTKMAVHFGGELLERFGVRRDRNGIEDAKQVLATRPIHA